MSYQNRKNHFSALFPKEPSYRWKQIETALFSDAKSWDDVSNLPKNLRETLAQEIPWMSHELVQIFQSKRRDTFKAVLQSLDGMRYETVLMANAKDQWTICVSSQIGCAMKCTFCATGTMGLKRSLDSDEIIDQYRFWKSFLKEHPDLSQRISNVVFMGMGEPLANYENVKETIKTWLTYTDMGPTKITVSSVGILTQLEKILHDATWPHVRIAISLHSANAEKRQEIVPSTVPNFLPRLAKWARDYGNVLGNRNHYITFEYTLLNGVNDTEEHAHELAKYVQTTGANKINVIPYNPVPDKPFSRSQKDRIVKFKEIVASYDIDITQRKTMGDDIAAACGQLVYKQKKNTGLPML